ncbi:6453_t:CDS:1, partial [Cetraspora pellucida]
MARPSKRKLQLRSALESLARKCKLNKQNQEINEITNHLKK